MEEFAIYFELGIRHIASFQALDHLFFVLALVVVFQIVHLKKMLILVTAFTITHSVGLFFGTIGWLKMDSGVVGFLTPLFILIVCISNIWSGTSAKNTPLFFRLSLVVAYGLIHGLGYERYLQMLTSHTGSDFVPTFAFDLGIEIGQLIVVAVIQIISIVAFHFFHFKHRDWILVISGVCAGASILLMDKAIFW